MGFPRKVLWKAANGREFEIDTEKENLKTSEDLHEYIAKLRKEHGYDEPDFAYAVSAPGIDLESAVGKTTEIEDLPEQLKNNVKKAILEAKPDPKKLN